MKKWFTVFRNRSDLPEMTLPLAILMILIVLSSGVLALKSVRCGIVGAVLFVVMMVVSITAYVLLIILWRKLAVIAAAPLSAVVMLCFDCSVFGMAVLSLSTLFLAYTLAVSVLSGEDRYRRTMIFSLAVILTMLLAGTAWIGLNYDSYGEFFLSFREELAEQIKAVYANASFSQIYTRSLDTVPVQITESEAVSLVASIMAAIPAYTAMAGLLFAWLVDGMLRFVLAQLDAIDDFLPRTHRITLPKYYAIGHITVTLLMMFTSPVYNPLIYTVLRSLFLSGFLPCLYIGCVKLRRSVMIRLYFIHGKRAISLFILLFTVMLVGVSNFAVFFSLVGAVCTLRFHRKMKERLCDSI